MPDWFASFLKFALETTILFFMFIGLLGLFIPVFPGLVIIWMSALLYAIIQNAAEEMTTWTWIAFSVISILMIAGNIADNLIIAHKMREHYIPWRSIILAFAAGIFVSIFFTPLIGLVAAPLGLFLAELNRLKDRRDALQSTKVYMIGWGWAFGTRFIIGLIMISLWMIWAWA